MHIGYIDCFRTIIPKLTTDLVDDSSMIYRYNRLFYHGISVKSIILPWYVDITDCLAMVYMDITDYFRIDNRLYRIKRYKYRIGLIDITDIRSLALMYDIGCIFVSRWIGT